MKDKDIIRQFNNIFPKDIVEEFLFPLDSYRFYLERLSLDPLTFFNKWSDIDRQSLSNKYLRKNTNLDWMWSLSFPLFSLLEKYVENFINPKIIGFSGLPGSGKSTLMHCLAGLDNLSSGKVYIGDTDISELSERALTLLRRDRIGFVFQAFNLVPTLSAEENITLPRQLGASAPPESWVNKVVEAVGLSDRLHHRPNELSGGQQQRVAVARALAGQPEIIFADEPTGNLDSKTGDEILQFMQDAVRDLDQTIVMVTHDPSAAAHADRVVFLADGRIVQELKTPSADLILDTMKQLGD